ncbi:GNAT family N-acetyltransferase [Aquimarina sp. 2201CG5-10]|uniref:GNAT family N-acetyltransferase n=1 Tax=Aquimarina callyspongiae TaxID=3098150 RepID=UPI002AB538A2|nr:GNAT family N-acetyltransferase [Aquimarina sp. 2201CG5-10]MDY8137787.1 GNAT family N-acetyltransferase [Aquimarina sp. 2201CG5-10]
MKVENSTTNDIDEIFRLYKIASEYQKSKKTVVVWPEFERELVETEIKENRQWKLIIDNQIACIWTITYSDEQIWEERNKDSAIYIHRIATNPEFRGENFVAMIVNWAKEYALHQNKDFIRLDTLGNNTKLIKHYTNAGFDFLGMFDLKNTQGLPDHYSTAPACLFEINIDKNQ